MAKLIDVARIVRSKNAGPLYVTFDIMFDSKQDLHRASAVIDEKLISTLYCVDEKDVSIIPYDVVNSMKITIPRDFISGEIGDDDIYGCQQHVKLSHVEI